MRKKSWLPLLKKNVSPDTIVSRSKQVKSNNTKSRSISAVFSTSGCCSKICDSPCKGWQRLSIFWADGHLLHHLGLFPCIPIFVLQQMCKSETHQVPLRCRQGHGLVPVPSWPHTGRKPRAGGQCVLQEKDTKQGEPELPLERRQGRDLQWKEKLCHVSQQSCSCPRAQIREESHKREGSVQTLFSSTAT